MPITDVPQMNCAVTSEMCIANGIWPVNVKAIIDTGSNRSAVSPRLALLLGLEYRGDDKVDSATEKGAQVGRYYGASFVFGNIQVGPRYVHVVDMVDDDDESKSIDALIGTDIIGLGRLTIEPSEDKHYRYEFSLELKL